MRRRPTGRPFAARNCARVLCLVALLWPTLAALSLAEAASMAAIVVRLAVPRSLFAQSPPPTREASVEQRRRYAQRIKLSVRDSHEIYSYEPVVSATVIDLQTASAEVRDGRTVVVKGLAPGETILVVSTRESRTAYAVEVARRPAGGARKTSAPVPAERPESYSGTYALTFSPASGGAPSLLRHTFDFRRSYGAGRVFRAGADVSQFFGRGECGLARPLDAGLGADRLTLGLDSAAGTFDLLDSDLNVSPLGPNGFRLRGPHLVAGSASPLRGAELFAGVARPSPAFFDGGEGRLAGVLVPVVDRGALQARAGVVWVSPRRELRGERGGLVLQTDARYKPSEQLSAEAEAAYANGGLSLRGRFDAEVSDFKFYGEALKVDKDSPYVSIGAQPGGRALTSFGLRWQRWQRLAVNASFRRTTTESPSVLRRSPLDGSTLFASAAFRATRGTRFSFSLTRQQLETNARAASDFIWHLQTTAATFKYYQRLGRRWSNDFEARLTSSAETEAGAQVGRGLQIREQLRFNWRGGSVTGYLNHLDNSPTLAGILIRNPALLPEAAREAFEADPIRFLITNRHLLPQLLPGAELPLTRGSEVGARFQTSYSRFDFNGDARYGAGEFSAMERRDLFVAAGVTARLDAANTVQLSGSRLFGHEGVGGQTALTVSFFHRFGAESGGGMSLAKLLGLDRGHIRGRVFFDLDADGQDDAGEPGAAGLRVVLDGDRSVTTDAGGNFDFGAAAGEHTIALVSERLGVQLRASSPTEQRVYVVARESARLSFGLNDFGFVSGRVFNDLSLAADQAPANDAPGVGGVLVRLRPATGFNGPVLSQTVGAGGAYEFRNVPPGSYTLEVDPATLPADFRLHADAAWPLTVSPLRGVFASIPVAAQRAVAGRVFIDGNRDGNFDPQRDSALAGISVSAAGVETLTAADGSYLLRNLPAGRVRLRAVRAGGDSREVTVELEAGPSFVRNLNLIF
jgi:Pilus formation protein N terminal region